jgi:Fic family protein
MAAEDLPDPEAAALELLQLERRQPELARALERLADRNEQFPNLVTAQRVERLRATHDEIARRALKLRALLLHAKGHTG